MAKADLSADRLRELLDYNPETGVFTWRVRRNQHVHLESIAGTTNINGYIQICVDRRVYRAHRLAWLYVHGHWPANDIDHINGDRKDNRLANLREATRSENLQNQRRGRGGTSAFLGVSWRPYGKWSAQIYINGRKTSLGCFTTEEAAAAAYLAAKRANHPFGTL